MEPHDLGLRIWGLEVRVFPGAPVPNKAGHYPQAPEVATERGSAGKGDLRATKPDLLVSYVNPSDKHAKVGASEVGVSIPEGVLDRHRKVGDPLWCDFTRSFHSGLLKKSDLLGLAVDLALQADKMLGQVWIGKVERALFNGNQHVSHARLGV